MDKTDVGDTDTVKRQNILSGWGRGSEGSGTRDSMSKGGFRGRGLVLLVLGSESRKFLETEGGGPGVVGSGHRNKGPKRNRRQTFRKRELGTYRPSHVQEK